MAEPLWTAGRLSRDWLTKLLPDAGTATGCRYQSITTAAKMMTAFPRCQSACAAWRATGPPAWLLTAPVPAKGEAPICLVQPLAAKPPCSQGHSCTGML